MRTITIRIDTEVWEALQARATRPFEDTPNSVLRQILDLGPAGRERRGADMSYEELLGFLDGGIMMREVYQPWIVLHLVQKGGRSTLDAMEGEFPPELNDPTKELIIRIRLKQAVEDVLQRHGIARLRNSNVELNVAPLSAQQTEAVETRCKRLIEEWGDLAAGSPEGL
jgi:hypothetical protein